MMDTAQGRSMVEGEQRPMLEYASIGLIDVLTDDGRRDVMIVFKGDPNEESDPTENSCPMRLR